jgi:ribosomal protein S18 acetylase RimI-like enzyme
MVSIVPASEKDLQLLSEIGRLTFLESHGHSAPPGVINNYAEEKYNAGAVKAELNEPANIFHIITSNNKPAGYSKIILNRLHPAIKQKNITKIERLYLLKEFYDLKLGHTLLQFNIDISKRNEQAGMWLYTWKENQRAVNFYTKKGFEIIGSYDFQLSESHSNPNYLMFLQY